MCGCCPSIVTSLVMDERSHTKFFCRQNIRCGSTSPRLLNSLPSDIRQPDLSYGQCRQSLKTSGGGRATAQCDLCQLRLRSNLTLLTYIGDDTHTAEAAIVALLPIFLTLLYRPVAWCNIHVMQV